MSPVRPHLSLRLGAALAVLIALAAGLFLAPSVGLILAPAAVLLVLLAHGVFVGEDVIDRLRSRRGPAHRRPRALPVRRPATPAFVRRTGRLIAFALAVRPPPVRSAVLS